MFAEILEKDEEILWQSSISLQPQKFLFFISLIILIFGVIIDVLIFQYLPIPNTYIGFLLAITLDLIFIIFPGVSASGIFLALSNLFEQSHTSYLVTNEKIIKKIDGNEYNEYYSLNYTDIKYVDVRPVLLSFKKNVNVEIIPDFKRVGHLDWTGHYFKKSDIKVLRRLDLAINSFQLCHISDHEDLFKMLRQNHIEITYRKFLSKNHNVRSKN